MDVPRLGVEFDDGVIFLLDFASQHYYDIENHENIMRLKDMKDYGSHYEFVYDPSIRNLAKDQGIKVSGNTGPYKVSLKQMTRSHAYGMAECFGVDIHDIIGKTDKEFFKALLGIRERQYKEMGNPLENEMLQIRLEGRLPEIKIGEHVYIVKWDEKALIKINNQDIRIELTALCPDATGHGYDAFVDMRSGKVISGPISEESKPFIYKATIPEAETLDPVGVARQRGFGDFDLLWKYPLQKNLEAKLTAVFESSFAHQNKNEPAKVQNKEKPKKRKKMGL
jgi:hypothetical protein